MLHNYFENGNLRSEVIVQNLVYKTFTFFLQNGNISA